MEAVEMTSELLCKICREHKGYRTPHLNDKLYANFKGFGKISNLEPYTGLKALFLEGNAISDLEGLPRLPELRCLFIQQNGLLSLEGLRSAPSLATLNIDNNCLTSLEGLQHCPQLNTLQAAFNRLESLQALAPLLQCRELCTLDLQNNKLEDGEGVLQLLRQLPALCSLYLRGNPLVSALRHYRKRLVSELPGLCYLDDRPVFEQERRCAEAWARGGLEAEREARSAWQAEEEARHRRDFEFMQQIRRSGLRKRHELLGLPAGSDSDADSNAGSGGASCDDSSSDDGGGDAGSGAATVAASAAAELPEVEEGMRRLAQYSARPGEEEPPALTAARQALEAARQPVHAVTWAPLDQNLNPNAVRGQVTPTGGTTGSPHKQRQQQQQQQQEGAPPRALQQCDKQQRMAQPTATAAAAAAATLGHMKDAVLPHSSPTAVDDDMGSALPGSEVVAYAAVLGLDKRTADTVQSPPEPLTAAAAAGEQVVVPITITEVDDDSDDGAANGVKPMHHNGCTERGTAAADCRKLLPPRAARIIKFDDAGSGTDGSAGGGCVDDLAVGGSAHTGSTVSAVRRPNTAAVGGGTGSDEGGDAVAEDGDPDGDSGEELLQQLQQLMGMQDAAEWPLSRSCGGGAFGQEAAGIAGEGAAAALTGGGSAAVMRKVDFDTVD